MRNLIHLNRLFFCLLLLLPFKKNWSQDRDRDIDVTEKMLSSSIKIESIRDTIINGKKISVTRTGTGFFFILNDSNRTRSVIVTAKHTIVGAKRGVLQFNTNLNGRPNYGDKLNVTLKNFEKFWIFHPIEDVAVLPLDPIISFINIRNGKTPYYVAWDSLQLLKKGEEMNLSAIEDVYMIGYPKGFYDSTNNVPIARKGITASPVYLDFNGKKQFLVDVPIFSGSSGSPIFIYNPGGYTDKRGSFIAGSMRLFLLGIAIESREYDVRSDVRSNGIRVESRTSIPLGIAIVVKASVLADFNLLIKKANANKNNEFYFDDFVF